MHYVYKLQEAKKHNGTEMKKPCGCGERTSISAHYCTVSSEGGRFAQELKTRHHEPAA